MHLSKVVTVTALAAAAAFVPVAANAAGPVEVVKAGQPVDAGHGVTLTLTRTQRCVLTEDGSGSCKSVVDGNQPAGTVSVQIIGDSTGALYSPLYIGAGKAARMTVTEDGTTYDAQVVTLPGRPGYSTGYAWGAPTGDPFDQPVVTVYNAAGTVLASN